MLNLLLFPNTSVDVNKVVEIESHYICALTQVVLGVVEVLQLRLPVPVVVLTGSTYGVGMGTIL